MTIPYIAHPPVDDFGLDFSDLKYSASLGASSDTTLTVPGAAPAYKAVIKVEQNGLVWVSLNATAALPAGTSFAGVSSELVTDAKSLCRRVRPGDVLHFITATAGTDVSVVLYSLPTAN